MRSCGVAAEALDDRYAFRDGSPQVRRAVDEVALIEIVGHTAHQQLDERTSTLSFTPRSTLWFPTECRRLRVRLKVRDRGEFAGWSEWIQCWRTKNAQRI
jgi:hypothetical protein